MNDSELEKYERKSRTRVAVMVTAAQRGLYDGFTAEELIAMKRFARGQTTPLRFFLPSVEEL